MGWFSKPTERERWAARYVMTRPQRHLGLAGLDARSQLLYGERLPRGVPVPRFMQDRPPLNSWMRPQELSEMEWVPGQIVLGRLANRFIGHIDDRPMVTIAGARAGKTSTVLEPNLYLYPGSCVVLDPKGELTMRTARIRRLLGHRVIVLDPFGQSGEASASFNALAELDPDSPNIIDDAASISQALIVDDGDSRARHWNDSARTLLQGVTLLTLCVADSDQRNLVTMRQLLSLTHPWLLGAIRSSAKKKKNKDEDYYDQNKLAVETLLGAMTVQGERFGGILKAIGNRFLSTPHTERGSIFSTAAAQTDFLDSLPLRAISTRSDFRLDALRSNVPTTIYLCLPVGRMQSHFRWLRMVVQLACMVLEEMGTYPRNRPPILFMMEEFATLGHMDIMERAAAYFPGFGVKLWAVLQDTTQLSRYYERSWETFLGNAGLVQCFANGDQATLDYITRRLEKLIMPFELRTAFSRGEFNQLLMFEGRPPAAAMRLGHDDVAMIRARIRELARTVR